MAKVETRQLPEGGRFASVSDVLRALRGAAADELSAANLYSEIIEYLKRDTGNEGLIRRIGEIKADEEMHLGSLLFCVGELDKIVAENMQKGARGE